MAIVSIMHRISGVLLFLFLPFILYLLSHAIASQNSFDALQSLIAIPFVKFLVWALISASFFHLVAGIRHMMMDCGFAESLHAARRTAYGLMALEVIAMVLVGVWLW